MKRLFFFSFLVFLGGFSSSLQAAAFYQILAGSFTRASAVSGDGTTVTGLYNNGDSNYNNTFKWTPAGGFTYLPNLSGSNSSIGSDLSYNGSVVVGQSRPSSQIKATRWNSSNAITNLGTLSGKFWSQSSGVSSDGSVVVGSSYNNQFLTDALAFRWTAGGGMVSLGDLPGGTATSQAYGVSGDGSVVVGHSSATDGTLAFRWTSTGGMVALGDLSGGTVSSSAYAVSSNGAVVVGSSSSANGIEAFRWTEAEGMVGLGDLPGGEFGSAALGASADGSVIVGYGKTSMLSSAVIWDATNGMRTIKSVLEGDFGFNLTNWTLTEAYDVSDDGKTVIGVGINPQGSVIGWMAVIPEPETWSLVAVALGFIFLIKIKGKICRR